MRKKISNLVSAILMVLLISMAAFSALQVIIPARAGTPTSDPASPSDTVVVTPGSTVLSNLVSAVTYNVTVTSTSTSYINITDILLPTGWVYTSGAVAPNSNWAIVAGSGPSWVNFTAATDTTFCNGTALSFIIPVTISVVSATPTTGTWNVYCYEGTIASSSNPASYSTTVSLEFTSTMVPSYVTNATYNFVITTTNLYSGLGISKISVTFPTNGGWTYDVYNSLSPNTWSEAYNSTTSTFLLTGPTISNTTSPTSVILNVTMTVAFSVPTYGINYWNVTCWDSSGANLGIFSVTAVVDNSPPVVAFVQPSTSYYTVGYGNYIWVNVTVTDYLSIVQYPITVTINDSRFSPYLSYETTSGVPTVFTYTFENNSAIPNGPLGLNITAVDMEGNVGTAKASTTIQLTAPILTSIFVRDAATNATLYQDAPLVGNFWMTATTTAVEVNATFSTAATLSSSCSIYINGTFFASFSNNTWSASYTVALTTDLITLNITLIDTASPNPNHYTNIWNIERELTSPSAVSYTSYTPIAGGVIIRGMTASDAIGIAGYKIYVNGTLWYDVTPTELSASTLQPLGLIDSFAGIVVLNLFDLSVANVTLQAVNYGSNAGPMVSILITVPTGQWYPLQLYPEWNLVSWPLIPSNTATTSIYSLILKQGAADVVVTYGYNQTTDTWIPNPAQMPDGFGYWIYANSYDVLIVQGTTEPAPPAVPASYSWMQGWLIAGYKSVNTNYVYSYLSSLQPGSYFELIYAWNASTQQWVQINTTTSYSLAPGTAFWIYMYSNQTLIPPST